MFVAVKYSQLQNVGLEKYIDVDIKKCLSSSSEAYWSQNRCLGGMYEI